MSRKIVSFLFTAVLVFFMLSVVARIFAREVCARMLGMDNAVVRVLFSDDPTLLEGAAPIINWPQQYPFREETPASNVSKQFTLLPFSLAKYKQVIERYTNWYVLNYIGFVEAGAQYESLIGWNTVHATVIDLGDGHLIETVQKKVDTAPLAESLDALRVFLQERGIDFLYVQAPDKIAKNDRTQGMPNFSNENADALLQNLLQKNISFLDLRENIQNDHLDRHSLFYKTDNHWKVETGLWATGIIAAYLTAHYGFAVDTGLFSPDRYNYTRYEKSFLGSMGRKLTIAKVVPDDFTLVIPAFDTDISLRVPALNIDTRGSFDVFIDYDRLERIDYYNFSTYGAYLGLSGVRVIHNNLLPEGKKLLVITTSFGGVVLPFLSLGLPHIESLVLRNVHGFTGSVHSYIEQNPPDMVLILYDPGAVGAIDYASHNSDFDFR